MTSIRGILGFVGVPALLFVGVAFSASGCGSSAPPPDTDGDGIPDRRDACPTVPEDFNGIADTDGCPETTCSPDLYVNVRIIESGTNAVLTCDQVPATTVRVNISGVVTDFSCPTGVSQQQIPFYLDVTGTYTVMVQLLDGSTVLSSTGTNSIDVDCSGQTQTPLIDLVVL
jgi:hypothetical protein